jgi:hypothetical protein
MSVRTSGSRRMGIHNNGEFVIRRTLTVPASHHNKIIPQWTPHPEPGGSHRTLSDLNSYDGTLPW